MTPSHFYCASTTDEDDKLKNVTINTVIKQKHVKNMFKKKKLVEILKKPPLLRSPMQLAYLIKATGHINFFKDLVDRENDENIHKLCC